MARVELSGLNRTPRAQWGALVSTFLLQLTLGLCLASEPSDKDFTAFSLEELGSIKIPTVVGASKHEQKITDAPSFVTIVTRDEIQRAGNTTLAEVLNGVPGIYARDDRNYSLIGIRGFGRPGNFNTSFLVLVDGHRMNDSVTDRVLLDHGFGLDVDMIERVEVIRGPGASLYGDSAFHAVINVITRRGRNLNGAEASASVESLGTYQGRFSYGKQLTNGIEVALSGTYRNSDGNASLYYPEFDTPPTSDGVARHRDAENSGSFFGSVRWKDFTLQGTYVERTKWIPTASYGTVFNDPRNWTLEKQLTLDLKYEHTFENDLNVMLRLGYDQGSTLGTYIYDSGGPIPTENIDDFLGQRVTWDLQLQRKLFERHLVTAGFHVADNLKQDQSNFDIEPATTYLEDRRHGTDYAVFIQDEYQILRNLVFNGGLRFDQFDQFGSTVNPRLALIYHPVEKTTLKLLYGRAFRAPSPNELYYADGGISQIPSSGLQPETIRTYEGIVEQQLGKHLSATAAGFYYDIKNLIEETTLPVGHPNAGAIQLANLGAAHARGLELALRGSWSGGYESRASYLVTDTRDAISGARLMNSPRHLAKMGFTAPLWSEHLFAHADFGYATSRRTLAGNSARGFGIANFNLFSRGLIKGLELSAGVFNLFDARYSEPAGPEHVPFQDLIPQNGRTFRAKITLRF